MLTPGLKTPPEKIKNSPDARGLQTERTCAAALAARCVLFQCPGSFNFIYYRLHGGKTAGRRHQIQELRQLQAVLPPDKPACVMFNNVNMLDDAIQFRDLIPPPVLRKVA